MSTLYTFLCQWQCDPLHEYTVHILVPVIVWPIIWVYCTHTCACDSVALHLQGFTGLQDTGDEALYAIQEGWFEVWVGQAVQSHQTAVSLHRLTQCKTVTSREKWSNTFPRQIKLTILLAWPGSELQCVFLKDRKFVHKHVGRWMDGVILINIQIVIFSCKGMNFT